MDEPMYVYLPWVHIVVPLFLLVLRCILRSFYRFCWAYIAHLTTAFFGLCSPHHVTAYATILYLLVEHPAGRIALEFFRPFFTDYQS